MRTGVKIAIKKLPVHKPFKRLCSLKDNEHRELDSDHTTVLSCLQDKVEEVVVYFRACFGEEWYETALILMRISFVLFKVGCECIHLFNMMIYQWKYVLYKYQQNASENRDSVINPCLLKINMYNIYILDSSRNEHVHVHYVPLPKTILYYYRKCIYCTNIYKYICINFFSEISGDSLKRKTWDILIIS